MTRAGCPRNKCHTQYVEEGEHAVTNLTLTIAEGVAEFLGATRGAGAGSGSEGRTWTRDDLYDR